MLDDECLILYDSDSQENGLVLDDECLTLYDSDSQENGLVLDDECLTLYDSDSQENGLVLVGDEEDSESESTADSQRPQKALVSQNAAQLLDKAGGGTLGKTDTLSMSRPLEQRASRFLWGIKVETQHHSRSNRVSLFPLEYT